MGAVNIVGVLVFLAIDPEMPQNIASEILKGFQEFCIDDGTTIIGGQTIQNPWPLIGGEATGICEIDKIIYSSNIKLNDILVLTKPLGIQPIMAGYRIARDYDNEFIEMMYEIISKEELEFAEKLAIQSMTTSNKPAAEVMRKIPIHAATDITGFGLIGHLEDMLSNNKKLDIEISKIPVIKGALELSQFCSYGLENGRAAETAGGFVISVSPDYIDSLISELKKSKINPHIIGKVKSGTGKVHITPDVEILECEMV